MIKVVVDLRVSITSPVANAVQCLEDLMLVVDLTNGAFLLIEEDAVVRREALVEVRTEV